MNNSVNIVECPRDAMQGIKSFISTDNKILYINQLLKCGFDTIDFGSFVSPKAIPQMRDTAQVLNGLEINGSTKLLAIVANERGALESSEFEEINYLGYPFSVSEEFQLRNTKTSIQDSLKNVERIQEICIKSKKTLVVYLSMGFGNPYGEPWSPEIVERWSNVLHNELGIKILALSDTIGCASPESVEYLFSNLIPSLPNVSFGAHLHVRSENTKPILASAYNAGCRRFDGALRGFGGCPMAKDDLTGNMPTEIMYEWFESQRIESHLDVEALNLSLQIANTIFPLN